MATLILRLHAKLLRITPSTTLEYQRHESTDLYLQSARVDRSCGGLTRLRFFLALSTTRLRRCRTASRRPPCEETHTIGPRLATSTSIFRMSRSRAWSFLATRQRRDRCRCSYRSSLQMTRTRVA